MSAAPTNGPGLHPVDTATIADDAGEATQGG